MDTFRLMQELAQQTPSKIVVLVADGLGGLAKEPGGRSELEVASHPNLDRLAREFACGLTDPIAPGITPGSGPSHLALFGYDPIKYQIGRGVLEALGIDFDLQPTDVAARGNFCTVDDDGIIVDRRAGRIPSEKAAKVTEKLAGVKVPGAEVHVQHVKEHRFVAVFRAPDLADELTDTDPQKERKKPLPVRAQSAKAEATARLVNDWIAGAARQLKDSSPANMITLRGFSKYPDMPTMADIYSLNPAAVAVYPMYRGLAKLAGMKILQTGQTFDDELATLEQHWQDHDFFFVHFKRTDSAGEDGNFEGKIEALEELDRALPRLLALSPDVLIITGDHSTPAMMAGHSWHPVPFILASRYARPGFAESFTERECLRGSIGQIPATAAMPLAMAHALKLAKYGA